MRFGCRNNATAQILWFPPKNMHPLIHASKPTFLNPMLQLRYDSFFPTKKRIHLHMHPNQPFPNTQFQIQIQKPKYPNIYKITLVPEMEQTATTENVNWQNYLRYMAWHNKNISIRNSGGTVIWGNRGFLMSVSDPTHGACDVQIRNRSWMKPTDDFCWTGLGVNIALFDAETMLQLIFSIFLNKIYFHMHPNRFLWFRIYKKSIKIILWQKI